LVITHINNMAAIFLTITNGPSWFLDLLTSLYHLSRDQYDQIFSASSRRRFTKVNLNCSTSRQ